LDLPSIDLDEATFRGRDLVPFAQLLPEADAIMTAHIVVRSLDAQRPATLSPRILTEMLRNELHFPGVCFTDCMQMDAIAKGVGSAQGAVQALIAGADCVLISHEYEIARQSAELIVEAVENGRLPLERLQEAFRRVQTLRLKLQPPLPIEAPAPHRGVGHEIGRRAVTLIRGSAHADPSASIVVTFEGTTVEGVQGLHSEHAVLAHDVPQIRLPLEPQSRDVDAAIAKVRATGKRPIVLMRRAHVYAAQKRAVQHVIDAFPDALLVSTREPFDAFDISGASNVICTFGDDKPSMQGLADVLFDHVAPSGRYPLHGETIARA
jgi:beta-N-acetylhexosaminidase